MKKLGRAFLIVFAAVIAAYIGWGRVEAYRIDRDIKAIAARGEPVDLSSAVVALPSAQHQEAARLYADAAARAREIAQQDFSMVRMDVDAVVGRVNVPELEDTYKKDAPALQLLDRATPLPFAGFGDAIDGPEWMGNLGLQSLGGLAALRADLLAYRGDGDAAARALVAAVRIQRTMPDLFSRAVLGARQIGSLRILLRHAAPSPVALEALQQAFAELSDEDGLDRELMLRRARLIEQYADGNPPGGIARPVSVVFQPFFTRWFRVQIENYPEVIAAAREGWPDKFATLSMLAADAPLSNGSMLRRILTGPPMNIAALSGSAPSAGLNLAVRRMAIATLAIERYRRAHAAALPPSLDALVPAFLTAVPVDPFTGTPLVYKPAASDYLVYSVDANRVDDGGAFYGTGSLNPMPLPRKRDFGIKVPLTPRPVPR